MSALLPYGPIVRGAKTVPTALYQLTQRAIADLVNDRAMGAIHGPAGLGKTHSVGEALNKTVQLPTLVVVPPPHPTLRELTRMIVEIMFPGEEGLDHPNRFKLMRILLPELRLRPHLIAIEEAQRLNHECIELVRSIHDAYVGCAIVLVGGHGCWEVIESDPMLRSRMVRNVRFEPLVPEQVLRVIPRYHPVYKTADPDLISFVDRYCGHGNFRNWAFFTKTAIQLMGEAGRGALDEEIARNAFALLGGGADE